MQAFKKATEQTKVELVVKKELGCARQDLKRRRGNDNNFEIIDLTEDGDRKTCRSKRVRSISSIPNINDLTRK
jgi:hypothetical protein